MESFSFVFLELLRYSFAALAAKETALPPGLLMRNSKYSSGYGNTNKNLQMEEWAYKDW